MISVLWISGALRNTVTENLKHFIMKTKKKQHFCKTKYIILCIYILIWGYLVNKQRKVNLKQSGKE